MLTAQELINMLHLEAHPTEGGFYSETYRSGDTISRQRPGEKEPSERSLGTAIYYLLTPETHSRIHRLKEDEIYHFYLGDAVLMLLLYPDGSSREIILGNDLLNDQQVQVVVPRNTWQGALLKKGGRFALMSTTMAPGFDYADYEDGNAVEMERMYPEKKDWIDKLARH
ncbi:MAG: cupin domain-containing protein [Dehalococcoidales bacterium]|nr:cupin domain-containing protein [Dehalococcoidales bacterium]